MEILCPKHSLPLTVKQQNITLFASNHKIYVASCPQCHHLYISQRIIPLTNSFEINGITYQFLEQLHKNYPSYTQEVLPVPEQKPSHDIDLLTLLPKKKTKKKKHPKDPSEENISRNTKNMKKQGVSQAKLDAKAKKNLSILKDNLLKNNYTNFRVKTIKNYKTTPHRCPNDHDELLNIERIIFKNNDTDVVFSGKVCVTCRTAYLPESSNINNTSHELDFPSKKHTVIEGLSVLSSKTAVPTELTTVLIESANGKQDLITIVTSSLKQNITKNILWQGQSLSQAILRALATRNFTFSHYGKTYKLCAYRPTDELSDFLNKSTPPKDPSDRVILWIYRSKSPCPTHSDAVESITVYVQSSEDFNEYPLDAMYCRRCDKYYINATSFNLYANQYGMPFVHLIPAKNYELGDYSTWNEESLLHFIGYNVNSSENLPETERRKKLIWTIENGIMSKPKVVSFLEKLTKLNQGQPKKIAAVNKWKSDLKFIHNHQFNIQKQVYGVPKVHK